MDINNKIIINSLSNNIKKSKIDGSLNNTDIFLFNMLNYFYKNESNLNKSKLLFFKLKELKKSKNLCNIRVKIPNYLQTNIEPVDFILTPVLSNNTVFTKKENIFLDSKLYDAYTFNLSDILYKDNLNNKFDQISISTNDLQDGNIKVFFGPNENDFSVFGETGNDIVLQSSDINNITFYTESINDFSHDISIKTYTFNNGKLIPSNDAILTINRIGISNQPAIIGDNAIKTNNRVTTVLTLEMFTSNLTPPYNDPENDLIDAIRIDEISTANLGKFYLNNVEIINGQIITREDLIAELFTHEGPNVNTIETDAFNFSARDEGSQIWVQ